MRLIIANADFVRAQIILKVSVGQTKFIILEKGER